VKQFPYGIIDAVEGNDIFVAAVMHSNASLVIGAGVRRKNYSRNDKQDFAHCKISLDSGPPERVIGAERVSGRSVYPGATRCLLARQQLR